LLIVNIGTQPDGNAVRDTLSHHTIRISAMQKTLMLAFATLIFAPFIAHGQALRMNAANPDSALQTILSNLEGTSLSLHDAVDFALNNATSVRTAEGVYMSARGAARREAGAFDPTLFFSFNQLNQDQPTASFFSGATILSTKQSTATGGLRMNLPTGTDIEASLNAMTLETNSSFANLNPQYTTFGSLTLRQPLLRGFTVSGNKNAAKADRDLEAAKARYDQEVLAVSTQVEQSYWDLYAAERDYAVQRLTRDRADAFLKDTETRARTGLVGPNQVANAKTFLAEQEILLLDREEQLDRLSDGLSSLIGRRPDAGKTRLITVDSPPDDFQVDEVEVLIREALEKNLALQAAKADVEARRALSNAAFWEALPKVDLVASLGANGLGGTAQDVIFNNDTLHAMNSGTFGQAMNQVFKREFPTWSVGVEIDVPIGLRSGLGEQDRLEAEVVIAEQRQIQQARILEEEVRASYRELMNGKRRLIAARAGVDAAQEQVRIGLIEFENGRSTAFELVRLGADFAVAQQRYSQALVRSAKAAANLRQLTSGASIAPR
jgi:outer membrane protein